MMNELETALKNHDWSHAGYLMRPALDKLMKEKNITFNTLKDKLIKENFGDISSIKDIPKSKIFELIERIKKI